MKNAPIYQYDLNGDLFRTTNIEALFQWSNYDGKSISKIVRACKGVKGYGYFDGFFWASKPVKILSPNECRDHYNKWLTANYEKLQKAAKAQRLLTEDGFHEILINGLEKAMSDRGVNDYDARFYFKLKNFAIDELRVRATKLRNEANDFVACDTGKTVVEIAGQSATLLDREIDTTTDIRTEGFLNALLDRLYDDFGRQATNIWVLWNVDTKGERNVYTTAKERYSLSPTTCRNLVEKVAAKVGQYAKELEHLLEQGQAVDIDYLTLADIIRQNDN